MGGKLFNAERMPQSKYDELVQIFTDTFTNIGRRVLVPESFHDKKDHGDLDLIIEGDVIPVSVLSALFDHEPHLFSQNSSVISVHWNSAYQVDMAFHPTENFVAAYHYNRGGDAGNIIGRIVHAMGMKYGHVGLLYPVKLGDYISLGEVVISKDTKAIMEFLDLDYQEWFDGFQNPEAMFLWVTKSKYFNPKSFQFENLNHVNRIRNRKRAVYSEFVEWLNVREFPGSAIREGGNKAEHLWRALIHFRCMDEVSGNISAMLTSAMRQSDAAAIFNGADVMRLTQLQGMELGRVIKKFQLDCTLGNTHHDIWVSFRIQHGKDAMEKLFIEWCKANK